MADNSDELFKELSDIETWYERASERWYAVLNCCRIFLLSAALVSAVTAAALPGDYLSSIGRWIVVVAASLTAIANEVLGSMKVREMEDLRERGRIEAGSLRRLASQRIPQLASQPDKLSAFKLEMDQKIKALELDQHSKATSLWSLRPK